MVLQTCIKRGSFWNIWPKLVDVMNCVRKMSSYTTSFTHPLALVLFLEED